MKTKSVFLFYTSTFLCLHSIGVFADTVESKPEGQKTVEIKSPELKRTEPKEPALSPDSAKLKAHLDSLFLQSQNVNKKGAEKNKARDAIEGAMDWDQISKDCLPETEWKKQSASAGGHKNISDFQSLLKDVIVKTAYTRLDVFWKNAEYKFDLLEVKADKAHAKATFSVKSKDGSVDKFSLDYFLKKKNSKWLIYDVAFEDVRYSENIREQIKTFLGEKGFPSLLAKLRDRRKDLVESEKKGA